MTTQTTGAGLRAGTTPQPQPGQPWPTPTPPSPKPPTIDEQRAEYIAGLRALADLLERQPDLEYPWEGRPGMALLVVLSGDPGEDQRTQLAAWARALPGRRTKQASTDGDRFKLRGQLHGVEVGVLADRAEVCDRVVLGTREVVEEVPDPDALAAVPKVTVTKTVEDVEWVCRPLLSTEDGG